jgi:tRNA(Glu) U13 pseudouridine synthase TruD
MLANVVGILINSTALEGYSKGNHIIMKLNFTLLASCYATMVI